MIYIITDGHSFKIGFTAGKLLDRLKSLQTGNPRPLSLVTSFPGDRQDEAALHLRFSHLRLAGEWFAMTPEDLAGLRSFSEWLLRQVGRDDIVGDLADDWRREPLPEPTCYRDLQQSLWKRSGGNKAVVSAGHAAWREFLRGVPTRLVAEQQAWAAKVRSGVGLEPNICYWLKDGARRYTPR